MADTENAAATPSAETPAPAPAAASAPAETNTPVVSETPAASTEAATSSPAPETKTDAAPAAASEAQKVESTATSALASEPVKEPETKTEAKVEEKKIEEKKVEAEKKPEADKKPEEKAPSTEAEKADKPEGEQPELPKFEAFKVPETIKADEKIMGEVSSLLGQLELAKGDHKATQEIGQKLVDTAVKVVEQTVRDMTDYFKQVWEDQKNNDFKALEADKILGGDRKAMEANARALSTFLQKHGGSKEEVAAFRKFVQERGVDNSLPLVRIMNNLKAKVERYETESAKIVPGNKPQSNVSAHPGRGIMQKLYGKK